MEGSSDRRWKAPLTYSTGIRSPARNQTRAALVRGWRATNQSSEHPQQCVYLSVSQFSLHYEPFAYMYVWGLNAWQAQHIHIHIYIHSTLASALTCRASLVLPIPTEGLSSAWCEYHTDLRWISHLTTWQPGKTTTTTTTTSEDSGLGFVLLAPSDESWQTWSLGGRGEEEGRGRGVCTNCSK